MAFIKNNIVKSGGGAGYGSEYMYYDIETQKVMVYNSSLGSYIAIANLSELPINVLYAYNRGDACIWLTGGWTGNSSYAWSSNGNTISFTLSNTTADYKAFSVGRSVNAVDVTNYTKLHVKGYASKANATIRVSLALTETGGAKKQVDLTKTTETEVSVDISSLTGLHFIKIGVVFAPYVSSNFYITEIYFT